MTTQGTQPTNAKTVKITWLGRVVAVQPRIRLTRSFDQRQHTYLGYVLRIDGQVGHEQRVFTMGVGKAAQEKHGFCVGQQISGACEAVADIRMEPVEFYKASKLKVLADAAPINTHSVSPWHGSPPALEVYREHGHRRLATRTYESQCLSCMWGCRMAVEMIIDQWKPWQKRFRNETFCYGPKSCPLYRPGPTRKVPGRKGMSWEEEDWVDEDATAHRGDDD